MACSSVSQEFIPGTLVNQNKTNRRLSLFQVSFPWSLKFTFYYKNYHLERANWNVCGSFWINFYWSWLLQKNLENIRNSLFHCLCATYYWSGTRMLTTERSFHTKACNQCFGNRMAWFPLVFSAAVYRSLGNYNFPRTEQQESR